MPVELNNCAEIRCQLIETLFKPPDAEGRIVYGLRVEIGGEETKTLTVEDISAKKDDVQKLILLMTDCGVAEVHLMDVIEDFVQSLYM
jgi:arginine repressor